MNAPSLGFWNLPLLLTFWGLLGLGSGESGSGSNCALKCCVASGSSLSFSGVSFYLSQDRLGMGLGIWLSGGVLAIQHEGLSSDLQYPHKKPAWQYVPVMQCWEAATGGFLQGLTDQPS